MKSSRTVSQSLKEYARGVAGGLIFSLPLLYTMELWWAGVTLHPARLLVGIAGTFALLLAYNFFVGIHNGATLLETAIDSVEEFGLGIVLSAFLLWLLNRVGPNMSAEEIVGKIVIEACLVAVGVSVGTAQLGTPNEDDAEDSSENSEAADAKTKTLGAQCAIALCGAFLFAANIAPTEEIQVLAAHMTPLHILALALFSFALSTLVLYGVDFRGTNSLAPARNFVAILAGGALSYVIGLLVSAAILWFFTRFDGAQFSYVCAQTVVLGFAGALGASAGRLLLQVDQ